MREIINLICTSDSYEDFLFLFNIYFDIKHLSIVNNFMMDYIINKISFDEYFSIIDSLRDKDYEEINILVYDLIKKKSKVRVK